MSAKHWKKVNTPKARIPLWMNFGIVIRFLHGVHTTISKEAHVVEGQGHDLMKYFVLVWMVDCVTGWLTVLLCKYMKQGKYKLWSPTWRPLHLCLSSHWTDRRADVHSEQYYERSHSLSACLAVNIGRDPTDKAALMCKSHVPSAAWWWVKAQVWGFHAGVHKYMAVNLKECRLDVPLV